MKPHDVRPWHYGRRFFGCHCGNRIETIDGSTVSICDGCKRTDIAEWVPPAVLRDRAQLLLTSGAANHE